MPKKPRSERSSFSHDVVRYVQDTEEPWEGHEIRWRVTPSRLKAYHLAGALTSYLGDDLREIYASELTSRVSHYIEDSCEREAIPAKAFTEVFKNNVEEIIRRTFLRKYKRPGYSILSSRRAYRPLSRGQKDLNAAIFVMRLRHTIQDLASDEHIKKVCSDYAFVKEIVHHPERFSELEQASAPQLGKFMKPRIRGLDGESQRQEGLLALWVAARDYRAENFSPFAKLAKIALKHKFSNLLRYSLATKRRANRHLVPLGRASYGLDSFASHELDFLTCEHWVQQQAVYDAIDQRADRTQQALFRLDEEAYEVLRGLSVHNHSRSLSPLEINRDLLNLSRGAKQAHYKKGWGLENFEDIAFSYANGYQEWEEVEVTNEDFPHLNQRKVEIACGIDRANEERDKARDHE